MNIIVTTSLRCYLRLASMVIVLFCFAGSITKAGPAPDHFDLPAFYAAIAGSDANEINTVLEELKQSAVQGKEAYEGALLMKKAGLLSRPKDKLNVFKSGREKLEAAIRKDPGNYEYRFLRLIIQENVPKIVKYKGNIKDDSTLIRTSFKKLPAIVQQAVKDYSKKSKTLAPSDF